MIHGLHSASYALRLLVLPVDAHHNAFVAQYAARMARNLALGGDSVYLAITPGGWCTPFERDEPMQFVAWLAPNTDANQSDSRRFQRARSEAAEATRALVRAVQPECVLFVSAYAGHGAAMLEGVAASGVPSAVVVLDAHSPHAALDGRPLFLRRQAFAQQWVVTSAQAQRVLARRLDCAPHALEVCPEGVPLHPHAAPTNRAAHRKEVRAALGLPDDAVLVVSHGPMDEDSGCIDWAEAIVRIAESHPMAYFFWVGAGNLAATVRTTVAGTPAERALRILREGDLNLDIDLAADLAVFPARAPRPGLAVGRAMAAGIPLIATAVDPVPEVVRPMREGIVCGKANPQSLGDALQYALANPAVLHAMAEAAYLRIQDFSDERAIHSLRPVLERISVLRGAVRSPGERR